MTFFVRGLPVRVKNKVLVIDSKGVDSMNKITRDARHRDESLHNTMADYLEEHHKDLPHVDDATGKLHEFDEHNFKAYRDDDGHVFIEHEPFEEAERSEDRKSRDAGRKTVIDTRGSANYETIGLSLAELNIYNAKRWE